MQKLLVCTGSKVLLPNTPYPAPATIVIDQSTGKIIDIRREHLDQNQITFETSAVEWVDAGNHTILPGLVECVHAQRFSFSINL